MKNFPYAASRPSNPIRAVQLSLAAQNRARLSWINRTPLWRSDTPRRCAPPLSRGESNPRGRSPLSERGARQGGVCGFATEQCDLRGRGPRPEQKAPGREKTGCGYQGVGDRCDEGFDLSANRNFDLTGQFSAGGRASRAGGERSESFLRGETTFSLAEAISSPGACRPLVSRRNL
jgi:hypothetical protein